MHCFVHWFPLGLNLLSDTFYNCLKPFLLAVLKSGAILSRPLEEALYKSQMNKQMKILIMFLLLITFNIN